MNIIVLSRNPNLYSTSRLVEAGKAAGHYMRVVDPLKCTITMEQGKPVVMVRGEHLDNVQAVIPRIGASATFYGSSVVRQFEMMGVFSAAYSQAIVRSRDKLRSMQILSREGVGLPKTAFAREQADIPEVIRIVGGPPVVIKVLEGTQGLGVVLAESNQAATSVIEAFFALKANILVQEFIKEASGTDIRAFVVDGRVVGAMRRTGKEGEFRSNLHRGGHAEMIELSRLERDTALRAARCLGLSIAGVDMLPSDRGPLILEVNSSPGLEGIEGATKVDIAGRIIQFIERNAGKSWKKDMVGA